MALRDLARSGDEAKWLCGLRDRAFATQQEKRAMNMQEALTYIAETGYMPWGSPGARERAEEMRSKGYFEYEAFTPFRKKRKRQPGRYYLTHRGRLALQAFHFDSKAT